MKQARTILPTYSADVFGVCSALYELGGMTVMHDASGCNSTYSTHDEPRWYDTDSLVFISALTEMDAIMGNDDKVLGDMREAVSQLHPKFAALCGTPIPMMTGCDIPAIAARLERESGIPCFGFQTSGMRSYLCGASEALEAVARRLTEEGAAVRPGTVNILGATPLDFSVNGSIPAMKALLEDAGWEVLSTWAMGSSLSDLVRAGEAQVNLVASGVGMKAALALKERFGTPYVVGTPTGKAFSRKVLDCLTKAARDGGCTMAFAETEAPADGDIFIIGESVMSRSLAAAIQAECGARPRVVYPLELTAELSGVLSAGDIHAMEEEEIQDACKEASLVIADPLYRPILPKDCRFLSLPHEAFSGRIFRRDIPKLPTLDIKPWYTQTERKKP